jgi:hypothetical protein
MAQEEPQERQRALEERVDRGLRQLAIDPEEAVPEDFYARVMARAASVPEPRPSRWAWRRLGVPGWVFPALATGLVLSLAVNTWLGVWRVEHPGVADTGTRIRLAFADGVREQELRTLLLSIQATMIAGPSFEGLYTVKVPLERLFPSVRGQEAPDTAEKLRLLLEELRTQPAVRLAEPLP